MNERHCKYVILQVNWWVSLLVGVVLFFLCELDGINLAMPRVPSWIMSHEYV